MIQRLAILAVVCLTAGVSAEGLLPSAVHSFEPGLAAGFGAEHFPQNVLTGPDAGPLPPHEPSDGAEELLSLGDKGSITLRWDELVIINGPGDDFLVFENTLISEVTDIPFIDAGVVSVSQDGETFHTFPFAFLPPENWSSSEPFGLPLYDSNYEGLAGTRPTRVSGVENISASDPEAAGGNGFDLEDLGLDWVRYVRISDAGSPFGEEPFLGHNGLAIYDLGSTIPPMGNAGFELDTVVALRVGAPLADGWMMY